MNKYHGLIKLHLHGGAFGYIDPMQILRVAPGKDGVKHAILKQVTMVPDPKNPARGIPQHEHMDLNGKKNTNAMLMKQWPGFVEMPGPKEPGQDAAIGMAEMVNVAGCTGIAPDGKGNTIMMFDGSDAVAATSLKMGEVFEKVDKWNRVLNAWIASL